MSLVLKLSKCRLCLKLGDFYSIFAVDNSIQLSKMAMACSNIKIQEGDGLPEKVCGECVEKLSSAYLFKQQCERSDAELRKSLQLTSGISEIASYGRGSSDSGFSNSTNVSTSKKGSKKRKLQNSTPVPGSSMNNDTLLQESYSVDIHDPLNLEGLHSGNIDHSQSDSNEEDGKCYYCKPCDKSFLTAKGLNVHISHHQKFSSSLASNKEEDSPLLKAQLSKPPVYREESSQDSKSSSKSSTSNPLTCKACNKTFKLSIMLRRHASMCQGSQSRDTSQSPVTLERCSNCSKRFKSNSDLKRHLTITNCGTLVNWTPKGSESSSKITPNRKQAKRKKGPAICSNCDTKYGNFTKMYSHMKMCVKKKTPNVIQCMACSTVYSQMTGLYKHLRKHHLPYDDITVEVPVKEVVVKQEPMDEQESMDEPEPMEEQEEGEEELLRCRECSETFTDQQQLVMHLAAHMANMNDFKSKEKKDATFRFNKNYNCYKCTKPFKYLTSYKNHLRDAHGVTQEEAESIQKQGSIFRCVACKKDFRSHKSLICHQNSVHGKERKLLRDSTSTPAIIKTPNPPNKGIIFFSKSPVKCLICDITLKGLYETKMHNRMHALKNEKTKNEYVCPTCNLSFFNSRMFRIHIKEHNDLVVEQKANIDATEGNDGLEAEELESDPSQFCAVKIKAEPEDPDDPERAGGSGQPQRLMVSLGGFKCPTCGKVLDSIKQYKYHTSRNCSRGAPMQLPPPARILPCPTCDEVFNIGSHLKLHIRQHAREALVDPTTIYCKPCKHQAKSYRSFLYHQHWHRRETRNVTPTSFACIVCKENFPTRADYQTHYQLHVKDGEATNIVETYEVNKQVTPYQCHICQKYMPTDVSLKYHTAWHVSSCSMRRYNCEYCDKVFTSKGRHHMHVKMHRQNMPGAFKCHVCGKSMHSEGHYNIHMKMHAKAKFKQRINPLSMLNHVSCPICDIKFPYQAKLNRHLKMVHPENKMVKKLDPDGDYLEKKYVCTICCKEFNSERKLLFHTTTHARRMVYIKCSLCGKKSPSMKYHRLHVKAHMAQRFKSDPLKCEHCEETFVKRYSLHLHLFRAHNINHNYIAENNGEQDDDKELKELQCQQCRKILSTESSYQRHLDYHNSMRCNYCGKFFNSKSFLEAHLQFECERKRILGNCDAFDKKLKCHVCFKPFSIIVKLNCHLKTAHNLGPILVKNSADPQYVCDFCFSVYSEEEKMLSHQRIHFRPPYLGCKFCDKKFATITLFNKHKRNHMQKSFQSNPMTCELCPEKFVSMQDFITHSKDEHNCELEWIVQPEQTPAQMCELCNKEFINIHNHMTYHEKYKCKKCNEYFFSEVLYAAHSCVLAGDDEDVRRITTEEGNFTVGTFGRDVEGSKDYVECSFCFKPYTAHYSKGKHDLNHTKVTMFGCRFCNGRFSTMIAFNLHSLRHKVRHYTNDPIRCRHCNERFTRYKPYVHHLRSVHQDNEILLFKPQYPPEECKICHKTFPAIHLHYKSHLRFRCQDCKKYICSEQLFKNHFCNDPNEDKSIVFEYEPDVQHLTIGQFDISERRHGPDIPDAPYDVEPQSSNNDYEIDINEFELDDSVLKNNDETPNNPDVIVSIPDDFIDDNESEANSQSFGTFTPIISSTVSLSLPMDDDDFMINHNKTDNDTQMADDSMINHNKTDLDTQMADDSMINHNKTDNDTQMADDSLELLDEKNLDE